MAQMLYPDGCLTRDVPDVEQNAPASQEAAAVDVLRGWLESTGPQRPRQLAEKLVLASSVVDSALARLEGEGQVLRGHFSPCASSSADETEWCNRRLLARIHRLTLGRLRREVEPVSAADFVRFLLRWQHVAPGTQLHGTVGLLQVLRQLQGYEISAAAWEPHVLGRRIVDYDPEMLDQLCLSGEVMWGRLSPHPAFDGAPSTRARRRVRPTRVAPVALFLREDAGWLVSPGRDAAVDSPALSHAGRAVFGQLKIQGASFHRDLVRTSGRLASEVEEGLWELVAAGIVTADGFDSLRALIDPRRRAGQGRFRAARPRHSAGRWALLRETAERDAASHDAQAFARQLLLRWGVVFRDLIARETLAPPWREVLRVLRLLEARGEIRGGRFVDGFLGEQFARPEALESLRSTRKTMDNTSVELSAADPLNLLGITLPGPRVSALSGTMVDVLVSAVH